MHIPKPYRYPAPRDDRGFDASPKVVMRGPFEQSMDGHEKRIVSPDELYLESLLLEKPS